MYHLTAEKHGNIACTGSCAKIWPPVLLPSGQKHPVAGKGVIGKLGTIKRPTGGTQVSYNGMPLYTYKLDTKPGQAKGQGVRSVWNVVKVSGSISSGSGY